MTETTRAWLLTPGEAAALRDAGSAAEQDAVLRPIRDRLVADALGQAHAAIVAKRRFDLPPEAFPADPQLPMLRAGLGMAEDIVAGLIAEYRDGTR